MAMKACVIFYSQTGNTMKAANILLDELKMRFNEVESFRIEALDESNCFFTQCARAFFKKKAKIKEIPDNLSSYELIAIGTPVWALEPTPAVRAYLEKIRGLSDKKALVFATYGSGLGKRKCLNRMEAVLRKKGVASVRRFSIQQFKINDVVFIKSEIKKCLEQI
jgi:flavodoxin